MAFKATDNLLRRLSSLAWHTLYPGQDTCVDNTLASIRERDTKENDETTPPDDEHIDLCCVWGVELYTPTHFEDLKDGFRSLGWETNDHRWSRNPVSWLYGLRRHQNGGAWLNLGLFVPENSHAQPARGGGRRVPLPADVEYAMAGINSISPSLVAITVCFVLSDMVSGKLDNALRVERQTFTTPTPGGRAIHRPGTQKRERIACIRNNVNRDVGSWFRNNLPGLFSSGILDYEIPTCEFLTMCKGEPFPSATEREGGFQRYLDIMGLWSAFDVWEYASNPGLKFRMPDRTERHGPYHSLLAVNEDRLIGTIPEYYGGTDREARIAYMDTVMSRLLTLWSILPMLEGYTQHLNNVRDSGTFSREDKASPNEILEKLGDDIAFSIDISAVTSELSIYLEIDLPLIPEVEKFKPCNSQFFEPGTTLRKRLEFTIARQVHWLQRTEESIRDQLTQYGSLIGASENVRLQGKITLLTGVMVILTLLTLVLAFTQLQDPIGQWWEFLFGAIVRLFS